MDVKHLLFIGIILIFIGIGVVFAAGVLGASQGSTKVAVGGFIGPIPFGFGNSPQMVRLAILLSLVGLVVFIILVRGLIK